MKTRIINRLLFSALTASFALLPSERSMALNYTAWPVTHVSSGLSHALFTKSDGSLWGIGNNARGQLGLGPSVASVNVPTQILTNGVSAVSAGDGHSLFIYGTSLWGMGWNQYGQLGDGTTNNAYYPEQIYPGGLYRVTVVAAGAYHSLFGVASPTKGGGLLGMGWNTGGELGDGSYTERNTRETIFSVSAGSAVTAVVAGVGLSLFIKPDGSLWAMGDDTYGELGDGTYGIPPLHATNLAEEIESSGVSAIGAGSGHSLFIMSGLPYNLFTMGYDDDGQLGLGGGHYENANLPTPVGLYSGAGPVGGCIAVAAGNLHSLCIKSDGSLWAMGLNSSGQLGVGGNFYQTNTPQMVAASNVVAVAAKGENSYFIKSDGSLWGMGDNSYGQLGTGDNIDRNAPVEIVAPPPQLINTLSARNLILAWPTNAAGFQLQSTADLAAPAWNTNTPAPVLVGSQFEVTLPSSSGQQFYRLMLSQ